MILIDEVEVEFGKFPNNEGNLNFNKISFHYKSEIILKYETDQDLFNLYILKKYMDDVFVNNEIRLKILYMPYSRMDRQNDHYTFNLKYVAEMINAMKFERVKVYDAHSDVTLALLDRCENVSSIPSLFQKYETEVVYTPHDYQEFYVFFPDAGAEKRFSKDFSYNTLIGLKARNFEDGSITKYNVFGEIKEGSAVVIIDDLCSKGGTFMASATELKKLGAGDIYLIVGHCEENIFNGDILKTDLIKKVYTTNSILNDELEKHSKMYVLPLYTKKKRYAY